MRASEVKGFNESIEVPSNQAPLRRNEEITILFE